MTRKHWLAVIGVIGTAAATTTGCPSKNVPDYSMPIDSLRHYLQDTGPLYKWEALVSKAVCQLEVASPGGLDPKLRICPGGWGPGGGGDVTPPPSYPK